MLEIRLVFDASDKLIKAIKEAADLARAINGINKQNVEDLTTQNEAPPKAEDVATTEAPKPPVKKTRAKANAKKQSEKAKTEEAETPTYEDLRQATVLAIQKDRGAVVEMLKNDFPGCERASDIPEEDRARAIEILTQITES